MTTNTTNEPSGSHALPQRAPLVDMRTLALVGALVAGGSGTSVLTSLVGRGDVSAQVQALSEKVEALGSKLDRALADDSADQRTIDFLRTQLNDHEARLREMERGR
jgi:hypothetical protein